jgi:hypothetical protein
MPLHSAVPLLARHGRVSKTKHAIKPPHSRACKYLCLQVEQPTLRFFAKGFAAYRQALKPRLLVLVGLVAGCSAFNAAYPEQAVSIVEEACMVAGFLSYKVGGWGKRGGQGGMGRAICVWDEGLGR